MNKNDEVRALYENFPYPNVDEDLGSVLAKKRRPAWNPLDSQALYFPIHPHRETLDVLIAGCGTNTGQQHAAYLPNMRFWAIDISEHSLHHARRLSQSYGLNNIEFFQLPIERVGELGKTFDYISCHGVLHHLENPVAGLQALASVLRPDGAMSLMVYAKYGRTGIYMLQDMLRDVLKLQINRDDLTLVQQALTVLPEEHPFRIIHSQRSQLISLEEIADMLLHPRDKPYAVSDVRQLVEDAGLLFQRFLAQAPFQSSVSQLSPDMRARFSRLSFWEEAEAMELFQGTLIKHEFCVTHPGRPTPRELFSKDKVPDAIPSLSGHLNIESTGKDVVLCHQQHQISFRPVFPIRHVVGLLKKVDGQKKVSEIVSAAVKAKETDLSSNEAIELFHTLYLADFVDFRMLK